MLVLDDISLNKDIKDTYVALGSFDGLHLGHLSLINKVKELATVNNGKSMVFTFKNHPRTLVKPGVKLDLIMTNDEKIEVLNKEELDILAFKEFDEFIMKMPPESFVQWLCDTYSVKGIVVGFNFRFGYKNLGDIKLLEKLKEKYNYQLWVMDPYIYNYDVVSSTRIRKKLLDGNITMANKLLSRTYSVVGKVVDGKKLGRTIGFPTANILIESNKIIPKVGVYYTNVEVNGEIYKGITSVGYNPTVNGKELTVETYILNFNNNIYGNMIKLYFIERIRDEIKFENLDGLISQLKKDKEYAEKNNFIIDK